MYYPTHIADDESDRESNCSAEIEGSYSPQNLDNRSSKLVPSLEKRRQHPWEKQEDYGLAVREDFSDDVVIRSRQRNNNDSPSRSIVDQQMNQMTELIKNERNRRLGVSIANNDTVNNENGEVTTSPERAAAPSGLLGNIKGWFGGGGNMNNSERSFLSNSVKSLHYESQPTLNSSRRESLHHTIHEDKAHTDDDDDDSSSSSSSTSSCSSISQHSSLDQRTRARHQALRYLSNSCVDAGRKSKTLSYIWGLERLDLKRRRDRFERELSVVEEEMNKDWSSGNGDDKVAKLAWRLARELPRLSSSSGADAGAGSDKERSSSYNKAFMSLDEYVDMVHSPDPNVSTDCEGADKNDPSMLLWTNTEALDRYDASLQSRLREAIERTKSLEKRLAVLEKTGDEIVGSLCEDLVDVTTHSNKVEARYVKRGKGLERKRRRLEASYQSKIKGLEKKVNLLENGILMRSGSNVTTYLDDDTSDSDDFDQEENEEDDEIRLEKKLLDIKSKIEQEKVEHEHSMQSVRRQCEQSKLKLSVARLVMTGDDNLREYISTLDRFDPSTQHRLQCHSSYQLADEDEILPEALPPPPPAKVTRGRAKLLKAMHLQWIYENRLAVSKAFNDAAINALEQELTDREASGQQMEVRCLNELMIIDSEIKDVVAKSDKKIEALQKEIRELQGAMSAVSSDVRFDGEDDAVTMEHINNFEFESNLDSTASVDNDSISTDTHKSTKKLSQLETSEISGVSATDQDKLFTSEGTKTHGSAPIDTTDEILANDTIDSEHSSPRSEQNNNVDDDEAEVYSGDINFNTPVGNNDKQSDAVSIHSQSNSAQVEVQAQTDVSALPETDADEKKDIPNSNTAKLTESQKEKVLKILSQELKCTLAEYQTSLGISSSSDRVEQLDYMDQVVLKIAEVSGIDMTKSVVEGGIKSWSHTLTKSKSTSKDRRKKERSKKTSSKLKRKKSKKKRLPDDGLTEKDRQFIASLSSAKFNDS